MRGISSVSAVFLSRAKSVSKSVMMINRGSCLVTAESFLTSSMSVCKSTFFADLKKSFFFQIISPSDLERLSPPFCNRAIEALGCP